MKAYAGIGSRSITPEENAKISTIAKMLSGLDYICYSGNANGSDIAFQNGSNGKCVIFLPWYSFNYESFHPSSTNCLDHHIVGTKSYGLKSVNEFHPRPGSLSDGARMLMARNYYQINGFDNYPVVDFVLCCANRDNVGNILGGTGQAVRIAKSLDIPIINIRDDGWEDDLDKITHPIF